jgi:hypothetical protein
MLFLHPDFFRGLNLLEICNASVAPVSRIIRSRVGIVATSSQHRDSEAHSNVESFTSHAGVHDVRCASASSSVFEPSHWPIGNHYIANGRKVSSALDNLSPFG